ncbi:hypothetical protein [Achromobacter sp. DH1f]|uniref:hypothetical protein n=1 Tax=Achromobacter sp. DH1f TaxID=1397275 RepID=UPI000468B1AE|nr:hypothetical protein [Achromobacter sp. DH1f]
MMMNVRFDRSAQPSWPRLVSLVGALALVSGLGWWGWRLSEPVLPAPAAPVATRAPDDPGTASVAAWLSPGPAKLDVQVAGALAGGGQGAAVLSVNGGPPQAYAIGDRLTRSARLIGIDGQALIVEHGGRQVRLPLPVPAGGDGEGIKWVPAP